MSITIAVPNSAENPPSPLPMCTERSSTSICHPCKQFMFAVPHETFQTNTHLVPVPRLDLSSPQIPQQATQAPRRQYNNLHLAAAVAKIQYQTAAAGSDGRRARCQNGWANPGWRYQHQHRFRPSRRPRGGPLGRVGGSRRYES